MHSGSRFSVGILVALLGILPACSRLDEFNKRRQNTGETASNASGAEPTVPSQPLTFSWAERKATLSGGAETVDVLGMKSELTVTFNGFAKGTKYTVGPKSGVLDGDSYSMVHLDVRSKLAALELNALKEVDFKTELAMNLPDGRGGKTMLPPVYFDYGIREVLQTAENGPVLFGPEDTDAKPDNCLAWPTSSEIETFGACTTVSSIDFVAVSHVSNEEKGRRTCTGYKGNDGKPAADIVVVTKETDVVIYERRSGKEIEKKSFAPDKDCPMFAMTSASDNHTMDAYPDNDAIKAWLRSKPKR